jgi:hypothetical protein
MTLAPETWLVFTSLSPNHCPAVSSFRIASSPSRFTITVPSLMM